MNETIRAAVERLHGDATSGASELLPAALAVLRLAAGEPRLLDEAAREVGRAQPSMACLWNAALHALAGTDALERFDLRRRRASALLARVAVGALRPEEGRPLRVVTCSFSSTVRSCVRAVAAACEVRVACAEGRPALEGRRLAADLAAAGLSVDFYSDAAIGSAIVPGAGEGECVVLLGADAVSPGWVINKVGSGMLAAAAARAGVPVLVAATRDKFVDARVAALLDIESRDAGSVWEDPPARVSVRNPVFERVPMDVITGIVTDAGLLTGGMVGEACRAASAPFSDAGIAALARSVRRS
jgi:translation initiation factor 2B subunit (eIF-2B alpha/beta/delta family)